MSLLKEIQNEAINSKSDLPSLLRKCKVLATRLSNDKFKKWIDYELNGYKDPKDIPKYRTLRVNSKGNFLGSFGSSLKNADIPLSSIPEEYRDPMSRSILLDSVASLQNLVIADENTRPHVPWNPDFVAMVSQNIYEDMDCIEAWKILPKNAIIGMLDQIRNKILNFVLEIETENPKAGEAPINSVPIPSEKVTQIFNTTINADSVQNVATGSPNSTQITTNNDSNDELFTNLLEALHNLNQPNITKSVSENIEEMRANQYKPSFKDHYQKFMSQLADHMQVLGPVVAPYLPALAKLVS